MQEKLLIYETYAYCSYHTYTCILCIHLDDATRNRARIVVDIGYTQAHHINAVPLPYKTVLMLRKILIIYIYVIALISPCHRGHVDGRFYARFGKDFIFFLRIYLKL